MTNPNDNAEEVVVSEFESQGHKIYLIEYKDLQSQESYYYYYDHTTDKFSQKFAYADKVYNDGFAPVITERTEITASGKSVITRYIQYYNPSQDLLIDTKFRTSRYAIGEDSDKVPEDAYWRPGYVGHKTIISKYINWNLLVAEDPINFYFVPTEKLQSKGFVRLCQHACENSGKYDELLPSSLNKNVSDIYHQIVDKYFSVNEPVKYSDQLVMVSNWRYKAGIKKMFADKLAAAKEELEAQGKQCGDR